MNLPTPFRAVCQFVSSRSAFIPLLLLVLPACGSGPGPGQLDEALRRRGFDAGSEVFDGGPADAGGAPTPPPPSTPDGGASLPRFDIRTFGANGSDGLDDTAAIQSALAAAASAGGGTIYFPPGTFITHGQIDLPPAGKVQLIGAGMTASVIKGNAPDGAIFSVWGTAAVPCAHVVFADLSLDVQNIPTASAIIHYFASDLEFRRVRFQNTVFKFVQSGVDTQATIDNSDLRFIGCEFKNHAGGTFESVTLANTRGVLFSGCSWDQSTLAVLLFQLTEDVIFEDCTFRHHQEAAITYSVTTNHVVVRRCSFFGPGMGVDGANASDHGVFGQTLAYDIQLDHCVFDHCSTGYQVGAVDGFRDQGSTVLDATTAGVVVGRGNDPVDAFSRNVTLSGLTVLRSNQARIDEALHPGLFVQVPPAGAPLGLHVLDSQFTDDRASPSQTYPVSFYGFEQTRAVEGVEFKRCRLRPFGGAAPLNFLGGASPGSTLLLSDG